MTEFVSFRALSPQFGLLQRKSFTKTYAIFPGSHHRSLTLARHQIRTRRSACASTRAESENTTASINTLPNSRPSSSALLLGKSHPQPQQRRRANNTNGGYSSDEGSSSSENAAFLKNKSPPLARHSVGLSTIRLDPSAHDISWDACTVRGFEDGSLVFKFDQLDPRIEEVFSTSSSATIATATSTATDIMTNITNSNTSTVSRMNSSSSLSTATSTLANFAWSNALKLGVKFPQQFEITLRKLEEYLIEFNGRTVPAKVELKHSLFKTYEKAVKRQEKIRINEGIAAGIEKMLLKENENDSLEIKEESSSGSDEESSLDAAALEELRSSIQQRGITSAADEMSSSSPPAVTSLYGIVQAFYRTLLLTPIVFFLSTISSLITWVVHLPLQLYRMLPYGFRKLFHNCSWPPKVTTRHVSPGIHALFMDASGFNRSSLADAGFDAQGRCSAPLAPLSDIPRWKLEQLVGCGISNANLYRSALTHPTALPLEARGLSYERLEYLGDAVLELCTRQLLMARAPEADEGELTNQGQFLVSGSTVNKYGSWMGLDKWVLCNAYSMRDSLVGSPHILGDAFEALLAAVYIDRGLEAARKLLIRVFNECPSIEWAKIGFMRDHKGDLIKIAHQRRKPIPTYIVVSARQALYKDDFSSTTDDDGTNGSTTTVKKKYWTVEVEFDGEVIGSGSNFEKREAEREAAKAGLAFLGELNESDDEE